MRLCALKLASGEPAFARRLDGHDPGDWPSSAKSSRRFAGNRIPGTLPDILSACGDRVFMGWTAFDAEGNAVDDPKRHLFSATGFLDDTWWHRTYWQYGTWMRGGFGGWPQAARRVPAGRLIVVGDEALFAFGRSQYDVGNPEGTHAGHVGVVKDTYQDSGRIDHPQNPYHLYGATRRDAEGPVRGTRTRFELRWETPVPILVRAMVLADRTLFLAGPRAGEGHRGLAQLDQVRPGVLSAVSGVDGKTLANCELAVAPVFEGMAAADGRLLLACSDGSVCCFAAR